MRSKEVGNAQSVQPTSDIFLTLLATVPGQKNGAGVLTQKFVDKYTKNVRLCIRNVSHAWFSVPIFQEDKYAVKRLDEAPAMRFRGGLSHTKLQEQGFYRLVRHSLRCRIAQTHVPNGVEDFLNTYVQECPLRITGSTVRNTKILTHQVSMPQNPQPSQPTVRNLHPGVPPPNPPQVLAAAPMVDDVNDLESASEGPEEVHNDSSLKMLYEDLEVGQSTQGWD